MEAKAQAATANQPDGMRDVSDFRIMAFGRETVSTILWARLVMTLMMRIVRHRASALVAELTMLGTLDLLVVLGVSDCPRETVAMGWRTSPVVLLAPGIEHRMKWSGDRTVVTFPVSDLDSVQANVLGAATAGECVLLVNMFCKCEWLGIVCCNINLVITLLFLCNTRRP